MIKYRDRIIIVFMLCSVFLGGCMTNKTYNAVSQNDVQVFYEDFMDAAKDNWSKAVILYAHYEQQENLELALKSNLKILKYEIITINQLSEQLWSIEAYTESTEIPLGCYGMHYIGVVNGNLRVMTNIQNIPSELKEGVEITPYIIHGPGIVSPEDIIGSEDDTRD